MIIISIFLLITLLGTIYFYKKIDAIVAVIYCIYALIITLLEAIIIFQYC